MDLWTPPYLLYSTIWQYTIANEIYILCVIMLRGFPQRQIRHVHQLVLGTIILANSIPKCGSHFEVSTCIMSLDRTHPTYLYTKDYLWSGDIPTRQWWGKCIHQPHYCNIGEHSPTFTPLSYLLVTHRIINHQRNSLWLGNDHAVLHLLSPHYPGYATNLMFVNISQCWWSQCYRCRIRQIEE